MLDSADRWTLMELVAASDKDKWLDEKSKGKGIKDKRLSTLDVMVTTGRPLFRTAATLWDTKATVDKSIFRDSPASVEELADSVVRSSYEPMGFCHEVIKNAGGSVKSGLGQEMQIHYFTLWLMACVDGYDLRRSVAAEHISRRVLQQTRALRRNSKSPDYEGLDSYIKHMGSSFGLVSVAKFEKFISVESRDAAQILKQNRLQREELETDRKRKPKGGGKGEKDDA